MHRKATAWNQHRHHQDPRYNNVVLHVVLQPDGRANRRSTGQVATYRQDGHEVPLMELSPEEGTHEAFGEGATVDTAFAGLHKWRTLSWQRLGQLLDQAGETRFLQRSDGFGRALGQENGDELLYSGILEALGYSRNREPFAELARRLPWHSLREISGAVPHQNRSLAIRCLLLSVAGLRGEETGAAGEPCSSLGARLAEVIRPMNTSAWCFASVRPANQPRRRVAGAATLLARYTESGLLPGLLPMAREETVVALCAALTVGQGGTSLIGRSRALDMAINVVLPLLHAWGLSEGDAALAGSCLRLYRGAPRLAENEITREMVTLLGLSPGNAQAHRMRGRALALGALRQQGLMHLYQMLLEEGSASKNSPWEMPSFGLPLSGAVKERPARYTVPIACQGTPLNLPPATASCCASKGAVLRFHLTIPGALFRCPRARGNARSYQREGLVFVRPVAMIGRRSTDSSPPAQVNGRRARYVSGMIPS